MKKQLPLHAAVVILMAACNGATAPRHLEVRLVEPLVWSGGEALFVSATFTTPSLPTARHGTSALTVRRVDDSTVAVRLPDGNGPLEISIETSGYAPSTDTVVLHGFRASEDGPLLTGFLQALPGNPWVLGAGDPGLVEVDVRNNVVLRSWPDSVHSPDCTWGVGPSVTAGRYVLFGKASGGGCTHAWTWQYGPALAREDSVGGAPDTWSLAAIGPGGRIGGSDDHVTISHCDSLGCSDVPYMNLGGSLTGVTIGRTARRAVLHNYYGLTVDATSGDTLYRLPLWSLGHTEGVGFSEGEDTLYAVITGPAHTGGGPATTLVMARSADGALLATTAFAMHGYDVARDVTRPWLYVAAFAGAQTTSVVPVLVVLEQGTLTRVAQLRAPAGEALSLTLWHQFRLVPDPARSAVYVVATKQLYDLHGQGARIYRFDLLP